MAIFIIDKLKPKNNAAFTIMDTMDIDHHGENLEYVIDALDDKINTLIEEGPVKSGEIEMDIFENILCWRQGEEQWKPLFDFSNMAGGGDVSDSEVYVGPDEPTDPNVKVWIKTPTEGETDEDIPEVVGIPTKVSELENDKGFISVKELKENLKFTLTDQMLMLVYDGTMLNGISLKRLKEALK